MSASMQAGMAIMKNLMAVGAGSFVGGGARYLVACAARRIGWGTLPVATFAVNVLGCFAIGFLASLHTLLSLCVAGSFALGWAALIAGHALAKSLE